MNEHVPSEQTQNLINELRRGTLVLAVLSQLEEPQYGYSLKQRLAERSLDVEQGTLYPLLRRLEKQGLLDSEWSIETSRPRRYYVLNQNGQGTLDTLTREWSDLTRVMDQLLSQRAPDAASGLSQRDPADTKDRQGAGK